MNPRSLPAGYEGFHVFGFFDVDLASTDGLAALPVAADQVFSNTSTTAFSLAYSGAVIGAYAGHATIIRGRIVYPSALQVAYSEIRPLEAADGSPGDLPNFMSLVDHPLIVPSGEPLSLEAQCSSTAEQAYGLLFVTFGPKTPIPPGPVYAIRFTETATFAAVQGTWVSNTPTYASTLPSGEYYVVGLEVWGTTTVAARLILPGQITRPGVLGMTAATQRTASFFYDRSFGAWGKFHSQQMPTLQLMCNAADSAYTGVLYVVPAGAVGVQKHDLGRGGAMPAGAEYGPLGGPRAPMAMPSGFRGPTGGGR